MSVYEQQHYQRTLSEVLSWTAAGIVSQNERRKEFEGGRRPTKGRSGTKGEMNRQISVESEQMLRTERPIRSVSEGRMIILFNSSTLQRGSHFVEEFFNIERRINNDQSQRSTTEDKRETETDSVN